MDAEGDAVEAGVPENGQMPHIHRAGVGFSGDFGVGRHGQGFQDGPEQRGFVGGGNGGGGAAAEEDGVYGLAPTPGTAFRPLPPQAKEG